ncbi:MAG: D-alanine--D-alanine ligase [Deltaproteobacteria bacterium]|jgi:D-alanine-D-alanine ligase|nr:D-alanine--D-alanine ligase [Deltaproteobacteria bacterium]
MAKVRLALLVGGRSSERAVSLASGQNVLAALNKERYQVEVFDPADELGELAARSGEIDVVFPVLHGAAGEDGSIQGFLNLLNLPFVGSGVLASAVCMDKQVTKDVYRKWQLPVAPDLLCLKSKAAAREQAEEIGRLLSYPAVIKPMDQGSSVGLTIARNEAEGQAALEAAWKYSPRAMAEKFISGRELTVGVLGNERLKVLPPVEIIPAEGHRFFDYDAKYTPGQAQEICPAPLTAEETATVCQLALKAHEALGCRGLSRTDFIYSQNAFCLLETNTLPGLTENSLLPKAALAAGLSFSALLDTLIDLALDLG